MAENDEPAVERAARIMEEACPGVGEAWEWAVLRDDMDERLEAWEIARRTGLIVNRPVRLYPRRSKLRETEAKWDRYWDNHGRRMGFR